MKRIVKKFGSRISTSLSHVSIETLMTNPMEVQVELRAQFKHTTAFKSCMRCIMSVFQTLVVNYRNNISMRYLQFSCSLRNLKAP